MIASLGHLDQLVIADAGLPVPPGPARIDLAVTRGVPGFVQVLEAVLQELQVERIVLAEEMGRVSPAIRAEINRLLPGIPVEAITHAEFKQRLGEARAVVRTGEFTPYANVILVSGVVF